MNEKWKTQQERISYQYNSMPVLNYSRYDLNITLLDIRCLTLKILIVTHLATHDTKQTVGFS